MAINNSAHMAGKLSVNTKGEYIAKDYGKTNFGGWFIKVLNDENRFMTNLQIRTESAVVAEQLKSAVDANVSLVGYIRTVNVAPSVKDQASGEWIRAKDDWRYFFFVEEVESVQI